MGRLGAELIRPRLLPTLAGGPRLRDSGCGPRRALLGLLLPASVVRTPERLPRREVPSRLHGAVDVVVSSAGAPVAPDGGPPLVAEDAVHDAAASDLFHDVVQIASFILEGLRAQQRALIVGPKAFSVPSKQRMRAEGRAR
eukprot:scaffold803_cov310-Pinguiococcus_pyrenoidosus.AAC.223